MVNTMTHRDGESALHRYAGACARITEIYQTPVTMRHGLLSSFQNSEV
jgi:hypothetical protein